MTPGIDGVFHIMIELDGTIGTKAAGRNAVTEAKEGFVLPREDFRFAFDAKGGLTEALNGQGHTVDVSVMIEA